MKRPRLSLDIDDVLADFMGAATAILGPAELSEGCGLRKMYPGREAEAQMIIENPEFYLGLLAMEDAARVLKTMARRFDVFYISARPEWLGLVTADWLMQNGFPLGPVHCLGRGSGGKGDTARELDIAVAVDDFPAALDEFRLLSNAKTIVFDRPWNAKYSDAPRLYHWKDADGLIAGLI